MVSAIILLALASMPASDMTPRAVELGGAIVAAEARREPFAEQIAVAAVIANRAHDKRRWRRLSGEHDPYVGVMLGRRQFAAPAAREAVTDTHRLAFIIGAVFRPGWTRNALMFATPDAVNRLSLKERWGAGGFMPIDGTGTEHVFFGEGGS